MVCKPGASRHCRQMSDSPELRARAYAAVIKAKRDGVLIPQPCERCRKKKTLAHHEDYARPLDVMWLCRKCHQRRHRQLGWGFRGRIGMRAVNLSLNAELVRIAKAYFLTTKYKTISGFIGSELERLYGGVRLSESLVPK